MLRKKFFHRFQISDFEFDGIRLCRSTMSADEKFCTRNLRFFSFRNLGVDSYRRGNLQMTYVGFDRSPMCIINLFTDQDLAPGKSVAAP